MHLIEKSNTKKNAWLKNMLAAGVKPTMEILEIIENSDDKDWCQAEMFWIAYLRFIGCNLTNHDSGGRGGRKQCQHTKDLIRAKAIGRKMSPEAVAKMKASKAANFTPDVRKKYRLAQLGKKQSAKTRAKRAAAMMGRVVSEETRRKIGEANKISRERYLAEHPPKCRQPKVKKERAPISAEARHKMRLAKLGKRQTAEAIEAAHAPLRGRKRSAETRAKMSQAKREGWARRKLLANNRIL
jgi:hypothetical protein